MGHSRAASKSHWITIRVKQESLTRTAFFESTYHAKQNSIDSEEQIEAVAAGQQLGGAGANRVGLQDPPYSGRNGNRTGGRQSFAHCFRVEPRKSWVDKNLS